MRRFLATGLVFAMAGLGMPAASFASQPQLQTGIINGTARTANHQALPNFTVRVRNVSTGQVAGTTTSSTAGNFSFAGLQPGNYVVEVVNAAGDVVGTSTSLSVAAGATVTVGVTATALGAITAASAGGFSLLGLGTIASVAVVGAAGAATLAAVVAVKHNASPSK